MRNHVRKIIFVLITSSGIATIAAVLLLSSPGDVHLQEGEFDPLSDWAVEEGFFVTLDALGFDLPTAIAVVSDPGPEAKDPIYFVTELRGKVKVVTNDKSVFTFAEDFFHLIPEEELPSDRGEVGMAGICLDSENGYVFVTFAYSDPGGFLRNNVVRFGVEPRKFSLKPTSKVEFTEVFRQDQSSVSHQISSCQVTNEYLWISVGDADITERSQRPDSTLGKVLRMTLDGKPVQENPFFENYDITNPANYVWATGFRNPWGLKVVDDRVFVADNGPDIDRFLEVHKGENYLWDGTNQSIGLNANLVLSPSRGIVQLERYPAQSDLFPERYEQTFFLGTSGNLTGGSEIRNSPAVIAVEFDFGHNKVLSSPRDFLRYRGNGVQILAGVGFGPTGLYFVPILPNQVGITAVYKIGHNPSFAYPYVIGVNNANPVSLMEQRGCFSCHRFEDKGRGSRRTGPRLDREELIDRLASRLESDEYRQLVQRLDMNDDVTLKSSRDARNEVLKATGSDRVVTWLKHRIQEPKFDDPEAIMPNLGISEEEATVIAQFLGTKKAVDSKDVVVTFLEDTLKVLPAEPRIRHLLIFLMIGVILGALAFGSSTIVLRMLRRQRK